MKKIWSKFAEMWSKYRERAMSRMDNVENAFNFPVSRIFWHILTILGVIGAVLGLIAVLYGLTPVMKRNVEKPNLAERQAVDVSQMPKCVVKKKTSEIQIVEEEKCAMPRVSLDAFVKAFPKEKFTQNLKKPQNICDASEAEEVKVWNDYYEEWEVKRKFPDRCFVSGEVDTYFALEIRKVLNGYFPCDSVNQQMVANEMGTHLQFYQESSRGTIMKISFRWLDRLKTLDEVKATFELWSVVDKVIGNADDASITVQVEGLFSQLEDFMEKNPVNGAEMMKKAMEVVNIAHGLKRMDVWLVSRASYGEIIKIYNTYDADGQLQMTPISDWTRATDQFLSMSNLHSGNEIDCNLKNYYKLYIDMMKLQVEENAKRVAEYNQKKAEAEAEAAAKKAVKVGIMSVGGWAVLIGAAVVILIALLLLMFNIQRTLLRMKEMMEQGQGPKASSAPVDTPDEKK